MADREVIRRRVGGLRVLVGERSVRVSHDLAVAVVFHHDHEYVVKAWNVVRSFALLGEHSTRECGQQAER